ncbi:hypothetical protein DS031_08820 [Bacillus taeanensis]|uniref:Uncharacterized protein n=1 Tax=Bacillus taeanensis TaxID=273032 RepID=A0A366XWM0_9BACI|nr:hypothetical protein DS031_08820 [Bacillus taeanensis]
MVTQRFKASEAAINDNILYFNMTEVFKNFNGLRDSERMLVDSDNLSFIYILDSEAGFVYIDFPEQTWSSLKEMLDKDLEAVLQAENNEVIKLSAIKQELQYLVHNIEGNTNYGEEMMKEVEKNFLNE